MQYTLTIDIPDTDLQDTIDTLKEKYNYLEEINKTEEIQIPAVLDQEWRIVEQARTETQIIQIPNTDSLLDHMWKIISNNIKWYVLEKRKQDIAKQAIGAVNVDDITPWMDVTIS